MTLGSRFRKRTRVMYVLAGLIILVTIFSIAYKVVHRRVTKTQQVFSFSRWWSGDYVTDWLVMVPDRNACLQPERVGAATDGGWWTCIDPLPQKDCLVYSYGISDGKEAMSFDQAMIKKGCQVHGFDPSSAGMKSKIAYTSIGGLYHDFGLGGKDFVYAPGTVQFKYPGMDMLRDTNSAVWDLRTVETAMRTLNHQHLSVLKIDGEGSEWAALPSIINSSWKQLLIEIHFDPKMFTLLPAHATGNSDGIPNLGPTLYQWSKPCPESIKHLDLLRELLSMATLWRVDLNGEDCVELSLIRTVSK